MIGRCWWPITGGVNRKSLGDPGQERDTRNRIVKVVVGTMGGKGSLRCLDGRKEYLQ